MKKIEFLAASLPNELKVKILCGDGVFDTIITLTVGNLYELGESRMKPIVRPLSDLTKPITQANYNDGKEFVPIVELQRLFPYFNINLLDDNGKDVIGFDSMDYDNDMTICDLIPIVQLLIKWHFDLITEECEKVYVSDDFNPYK